MQVLSDDLFETDDLFSIEDEGQTQTDLPSDRLPQLYERVFARAAGADKQHPDPDDDACDDACKPDVMPALAEATKTKTKTKEKEKKEKEVGIHGSAE